MPEMPPASTVRRLFKALIDGVREDWGYPVKLHRLLSDQSQIRVTLDDASPCISVSSVAQWYDLGQLRHPHLWKVGKQGELMGWGPRGRYGYGSFMVLRPEFAQIAPLQIVKDWVCDISDVHGFAASKSKLRDFTSTDQMVEANSREMIDEITIEKLEKNLAHREIRIIHSPGSDYFERCAWDGRVFLINGGGSHHFAAAKYIAARLQKAVTLRGKLYNYSLNASAIDSLRRDFEMFVISDEDAVWYGFHQSMESFRATWLYHDMPRPFKRAKAILLPKTERRSMLVATLLRDAGVVDLGEHLSHLADTQLTSSRP